jgi:outer membrane protein assembly factor BamB
MPHGGLEAFDANGATNCSGTPKRCQPLWTSGNYASWASPTIANGLAYVPTLTSGLVAFDAAGKQNCFGTPRTCEPVWTTTITTTFETAPATVAGHVLFVVGGSNQLYAFDADGSVGCTGVPKVCDPIWSTQTYIANQVSVANGVVYLNGAMSTASGASGAVFAYGMP